MADFVATSIDEMLDWLTGVANPPAVANRFITVFDGDPTGAGTEVLNTISGSATRPNMTAQMGASSGGAATNTGVVTFTASAVGSADVDYVAMYSASTGGTLMAYTQVTPKSVTSGDSLTIAIGDLDFTIT